MRWLCSLGQFAGRILLSLIFIIAGVGKILNFSGTLQYMNAEGLVFLTPLLLVGAIIIELVFGLLLVIGYKTRLAAIVLFLFLIPTTIIFHDFWNVAAEPEKTVQSIMFFKNLAIMGGLLILAAAMPASISFDCNTRCNTKQNEI